MFNKDKNQRKKFSNKFKRKIILEYIKGKNPAEIFFENGVDLTGDKKYASKLINKWKKEVYKNINILSLNFDNIDLSYAENEINSIGSDDEIDTITDEILTKYNFINPS